MKTLCYELVLLLSLGAHVIADCQYKGYTYRNGRNYHIVECENVQKNNVAEKIRKVTKGVLEDFILILKNTQINDFQNINNFTYDISEHLVIYNNSVNIIQNAFMKFRFLRSLEIHQSFFLNGSYTGFDIRSPYSFTHLNLSDNQIERIESNAFKGLDKLVSLDLSRNKISGIKAGAFNELSRLRTLILEGNYLRVITRDSFTGLADLSSLDLANAGIIALEEGAFRGLHNLQTLSLSSNQIHELVTDTFVEMPSLQFLDLTNNSMNRIEPGAFNRLMNLKTLNLSYNKMKLLPSRTFNQTTSLETLNLSHNEFDIIQVGTLDNLDALISFDLSSNNLSSLHCELSGHPLSKLLYLDLSKNRISSLEVCSFRYFEALNSLFLNNNSISEVPRGMFSPLSSLQQLSFSNNQLVRLEPSLMFPLVNLQSLDVSGNKIVNWDVLAALPQIAGITHIDLAENVWDCEYLTQILKQLSRRRIDVKPHSQMTYHAENVNGIRCLHRNTTSNGTGQHDASKEDDQDIIKNINIPTSKVYDASKKDGFVDKFNTILNKFMENDQVTNNAHYQYLIVILLIMIFSINTVFISLYIFLKIRRKYIRVKRTEDTAPLSSYNETSIFL